MKMKKTWMVLVTGLLLCSGWANGQELNGYLAYQYADEADHGIGPGLSYTFPLESMIRLDGRLSWYHFTNPDLDMVPIEVVVAYEGELESGLRLYGGLGAGYYLLSANRGEADNEFGFQILGGTEWAWQGPWSLVAELRWLFLDTDVDEEFQRNEGTDDNIELSGIGLNLGLSYAF